MDKDFHPHKNVCSFFASTQLSLRMGVIPQYILQSITSREREKKKGWDRDFRIVLMFFGSEPKVI
jgi:hypothetical protein